MRNSIFFLHVVVEKFIYMADEGVRQHEVMSLTVYE